MNRAGIKKTLRAAAWAAGGLVLACALLLAGALAWLRTPAAERLLAGLLTRSLAEQGLVLSMDGFSGPLPQRLLARNLRLSDSRGLWLSAAELELRLRPLALLGGVLDIPLLRLQAPELFRLPQFPPQGSSTQEPSAPGQFGLPVTLVLGDLRVEKGRVHRVVLHPPQQEDKGVEHPPPLALAVAGSGRASERALDADLRASLLHADGSGFAIALQAGSAAGPGASPDSLVLHASAREDRNGIIALLAGRPDLPAYAGTLQGSGTARDWRGTLDLTAGGRKADAAGSLEFIDAAAAMLTLRGDLSLTAQNHTSWFGLVRSRLWQSSLLFSATPGAAASPALQALLGPETRVSLAASAADGVYTVEQADADSGAWRLAARGISAAPRENGAVALRGRVNATLKDGALLRALSWNEGQKSPPLVQRASLFTEFSGEAGGSAQWLKAEGDAAARAGNEDFSLSYALDTALAGSKATLHMARVQGLGVNATASGTFDPLSRAVSGTLSAAASDNAPWQDLLSRLAGAGNAPVLGGELRLEASLESSVPDGSSEPQPNIAKGGLHLKGSAMRWPSPALQKLLGPDAVLDAVLSSDGIGFESLSRARYTLTLDSLRAGQLAGRGTLAYVPAAPAPSGQEASLTARLDVDLGTIAPLAPGFSGPARARLEADGPLRRLNISLRAASAELETPAGGIRDLAVHATASLAVAAEARSASGQAGLFLGQSPAGPVRLDTAWTVQTQAGADITAAARGLTLQAPGASLNGDMQVRLPQSRPGGSRTPPLINGAFSLRVTDWSGIAALSGLPLSGGPASVDAGLQSTPHGQTANLRWNLKSLSLGARNKAAPAANLNSITGTLEAGNLFSAPEFSLAAASGSGVAGPLSWKSGAVRAQGSSADTSFSLALRADDKASRTAVLPFSSAPPAAPEKAERLVLQGSFRLDQPAVELRRLALQAADPAAGLYLLAPATVDLAEGIQARGVRLHLMPGGTLDCDALFAPGRTELDVAVQTLPLGIARLFIDAPLLDGSLDASLRMRRTGAAVQGDARISATLTPQLYERENPDSVPPLFFSLNSTLGQGEDSRFPGSRRASGTARLRGQGALSRYAPGTSQTPDAALTFDLPLRFTDRGIPLPDSAAPLAATLAWSGPVEPLWRLASLADRQLTGQGKMDLALSGTLSAPVPRYAAYLAGGRYEDRTLGLLLTDIALEAQSREGENPRAVLKAGDGQGGVLALEASLLPAPPSPADAAHPEPGPQLALRGQVSRLQPVHRDDLFLRLSGVFSASGPLAAPTIKGAINVERGEITLLSPLGGGIRTLDIVEAGDFTVTAPAGGPTWAVAITVPGRFFIRSRAMDSEWQGALRVAGPFAKPVLTGSLRPVRGRVDLLSRPFNFTDGAIVFSGGDRINPGLNLKLTYARSAITAIMRVQGTADKPAVTLESNPPLPQDQILSQVLFGKDPSSLSRFETLQLANGLRELAGIGGNGLDPLTAMRRKLGVDVLRLGGSDNSAANRSVAGAPGAGAFSPAAGGGSSGGNDLSAPTLEAGTYINDVIYVGVEQGVTEGTTGVRVEVELFPNVTLQGRTSSTANEIGIGWKKDY